MKNHVLLGGTISALIAAALAWAIAIGSLRKVYYLAVLLPIASGFFLVVAWFLHLRRDGFFNTPEKPPAHRPPDDCRAPTTVQDRPPADPPLSLYAPRDGMVQRSGEAERPRRPAAADASTAGPALVVAAVELAILSAILFMASGVGASYFH